MSRFHDVFPNARTLIGVCHLPPLPDFPDSPGDEALRRHARRDLRALEAAGFDGILVENENDRPHRLKAGPETVAAMIDVTTAVCAATSKLAVGCEILLNDPRASLAVAKAAGARFIRTDYFVDRMTRPGYGDFDIDPVGLIEYRETIGAADVLLLADIQVKFAAMLDERTLRESARLAALHKADAIIVTGAATGEAPSVHQLRDARAGVAASGVDVPILLGSGCDPTNAAELLAECDGAIVGTSLMRAGTIDTQKAGCLLDAAGCR